MGPLPLVMSTPPAARILATSREASSTRVPANSLALPTRMLLSKKNFDMASVLRVAGESTGEAVRLAGLQDLRLEAVEFSERGERGERARGLGDGVGDDR